MMRSLDDTLSCELIITPLMLNKSHQIKPLAFLENAAQNLVNLTQNKKILVCTVPGETN